MGEIFTGSEIVQAGIQIEINGRDFYTALSRKATHEKAQKLFLFLAGEEEKHIAVFKAILDKTERYEPPEAYPGEYYSYMHALAAEHVFTRKDTGETVARAAATDLEALEKALGFEKDSIVFYEGMKQVVPAFDLKVVDQLIAQEKNHYLQLSELKSTLTATGGDSYG